MNKTVLVDFDGVMCDMLTPLIELFNKQFDCSFTIKNIGSWTLPENMKPIFLHTPDFFANLKPFDGAIEGVKTLAEDFEVYFVTDALSKPNIAKDKLRWREKHGLEDIPIIITGNKGMIKGDIIIDDAPHHLKSFIEAGTNRFGISVDLMGAPYTKKLDPSILPYITVAKSWKEIIYQIEHFC